MKILFAVVQLRQHEDFQKQRCQHDCVMYASKGGLRNYIA